MKAIYGISIDEYEQIMDGAPCAICGIFSEPHVEASGKLHKSMHLDHNHASGRIREPLCHSCNTGLGGFKDNPELLSRAIAYLEKHSIKC